MSRSVLILDDDEDLRTTLSDVLRLMCGASSVAVPDVASMIALGDQALATELAIIDVNLGPGKRSGLDAYHWLVENGFTGRVVFLTGHAKLHTQIQDAVQNGSAEVVQKPASLRTLCRIFEGGSA